MEPVFYTVIIALGIVIGLVIYGTIAKNRWGINFQAVVCPKCGTQMPRVRAPTSAGEAMWGGFTCPKCGCRTDKWGRQLAA
jgi:hypothetical protein